jgi:hypothetical protein
MDESHHYEVSYSFIDIAPMVYQQRLEEILEEYGDNEELAKLGKDYFRPLDFGMTVNGLLKMMIWARADPLDFNMIQDMVDHLFINYTRPSRIRDLFLYLLFIFIPFFIQVCLPNDPTADDYDETTAATLIRVFCSIILGG